VQLRRSWRFWIAAPLITIVLIFVTGGAFEAYSVDQTLGAHDDFCEEMDRALACHDDNETCLVAYHQNVTRQLARAKTTMEFHDDLFILNMLDSTYEEGRDLLASGLRETAPKEYEKKHSDLVGTCAIYP
jgi:hypothetical protein